MSHHCLIGPPGSGKSTFAQVLATVVPQPWIVSSDRIRAQLYGDAQIQGAWPEIEAAIYQNICTAVAQGQTVIYDATNAKQAHRLDWLALVAPLQQQWIAWQLDTPLVLCLERNQGRDRLVLPAVIEAMANTLATHPPTVAEGWHTLIPIKPNEVNPKTVQEKLAAIAP